jgi:predicted transglutaminase-like cysteine proteinase
MYSLAKVISSFVVAGLVATFSSAAVPAAGSQPEPFMPVGGQTTQPIGHYEFCGRYPAECTGQVSVDQRVRLTEVLWSQLVSVNALVTATIEPATDLVVWGREEWWEYPTTTGDCEDMVLLKRRDLIGMGWPAGALLITVARLSNGEGHAVLTVLTDRGDLILDNLDPRIAVWSATSYQFVKRQSEYDTRRWVAINDDHLDLTGSVKR